MSRAIIAGLAGAIAVASAGAAAAQPQTNRPGLAMVCVDVNGELRPPTCRQGLATRIAATEDSCVCPRGQRYDATVCPPGVAGPADSLAANRARKDFLHAHGTLVGASFEGRPLCVPPGPPGQP
jgi:hypothetical protein